MESLIDRLILKKNQEGLFLITEWLFLRQKSVDLSNHWLGTVTINTNNLTNNVYLVRCLINDKVVVKKFTVNH